MTKTVPLQLLIVDDHPLMRQALTTVFERHPGFEVMATANGTDALTLTEHIQPDIVLTDIDMQPVDGITLTRELHRRFPGLTIIGFSATTAQHRIRELLEADAAGVIEKGTAITEIYQLIFAYHAQNQEKQKLRGDL